MREAARRTRGFMLLCEANSCFLEVMVNLSIARAVSRQDRALASKLCTVSGVARRDLRLEATSVALSDTAHFACAHDVAQTAAIKGESK